ncbi:hypothetical protein BH18ACI5_BH18ACI5_11170 [soil metagenome]
MSLIPWIIGGLGSFYALHRLALWMEGRGWIYYWNKRGSSGSLGSAFLEVQALLEPANRHVLEIRRDEQTEDDDAGGPPDPGARRR